MGAASGTTWRTLVFFVPMVVVSTVLIAWQLYARRRETLDPVKGHAHEVSPLRASQATG
jgi:hypothetical protein